MSEIIRQKRNNVPNYTKIYTSHSFNLINKIHSLLVEHKFSKAELATYLDINLDKLNNMLSPNYNFTLMELSKLENFFNEKIIIT